MTPFHAISMGAGVQTSTLLMMAIHGEVAPMPDAVIFADTQAEPEAVYKQVWWLAERCAEVSLPFYVVTDGDLEDDVLDAVDAGSRAPTLPYFTATGKFKKDGREQEGRLIRQCTMEYKIAAIRRKLQELRNKRPVVLWKGMTIEEPERMGDSDVKYIVHRYPLALEHRMNRSHCEAWMIRHGYPKPPKSACYFCPFHSDDYWRQMKRNHPEEWERAVAFDAAVRHLPKVNEEVFLHRSLKPLPLVNLNEDQGELFGEECGGNCGV